jgi:hypothetical protein
MHLAVQIEKQPEYQAGSNAIAARYAGQATGEKRWPMERISVQMTRSQMSRHRPARIIGPSATKSSPGIVARSRERTSWPMAAEFIAAARLCEHPDRSRIILGFVAA